MNEKRGLLPGRVSASSKGQVTVFIIIGIIVLFAFAAILYFTKVSSVERLRAEQEPVITEAPQAFKPLQAYTENCLSQIGRQGLLILGQQGGYIYPDVVGKYSSTNPTEAEGISLEPTKVPYWHFNSEPNSGKKVLFSSLQPKLYAKDDPEMSMEAQLSRYVKEKLDDCLDAYKPFQEQGFSITMPEYTIDVEGRQMDVHVGDESVNFLLKMPVKARKGEAQAELDQFFVKIPLRLKHYYEVANTITQAEKNFSFLEKQGMELISVYSRKDPRYFPPTSDVTYELFSALSWDEFSLQQKFKDLLVSYVPMLRFLGSSNFYYSTFPEGNILAQKVVDNMVLPLTGAEDVNINFDYFGWQPYFKTNSEDGVITPQDIFVSYNALGIPFNFGTQRYDTHYDASYPVLVGLHDDSALGGEGFTFAFALESNIRNNAPAVGNEVRETYPRAVSSLACAADQKTTEIVKAVVVDSFTKEPLEAVRVGFTIPEQAECNIGLTDQRGTVESKFPAVYGGVVNFIKEDYLTNFYPIDTYKHKSEQALLGYAAAGVDQPKVIEMHRIKTIPVSVKKKELKKCIVPLKCKYTLETFGTTGIPYGKDISCSQGPEQCFGTSAVLSSQPLIQLEANGSKSHYHTYYFVNTEKDLAPEEEVILTLERVKGFHEQEVGSDFTTTVSVKGKDAAEVQLVPGVYKVSGMVTSKKEILIPKEQRCFGYSILTVDKRECFTMDEQKLNGFIVGSLQWQTPETYLTITPEQLYTAKGITFKVLTQDLSTVPIQLSTTDSQCGGYACLPGLGCAFSSCSDKTVQAPGRVMEDLQVTGKISELSQQEKMRNALEPELS